VRVGGRESHGEEVGRVLAQTIMISGQDLVHRLGIQCRKSLPKSWRGSRKSVANRVQYLSLETTLEDI